MSVCVFSSFVQQWFPLCVSYSNISHVNVKEHPQSRLCAAIASDSLTRVNRTSGHVVLCYRALSLFEFVLPLLAVLCLVLSTSWHIFALTPYWIVHSCCLATFCADWVNNNKELWHNYRKSTADNSCRSVYDGYVTHLQWLFLKRPCCVHVVTFTSDKQSCLSGIWLRSTPAVVIWITWLHSHHRIKGLSGQS